MGWSRALTLVFLFFGFLPVSAFSDELVYQASPQDLSQKPIWRISGVDNPEFRDTRLDDSQWTPISVPEDWRVRALPGQSGPVWYRLTIQFDGIPVHTPGIYLGEGVDGDWTYFNGTQIGRNGKVGNSFRNTAYDAARLYEIPLSLVHVGKNVVAVRVTRYFDEGGFLRPPFLLGPYSVLQRDFYISNLIPLAIILVYLYIAVSNLFSAFFRPKDPLYWLFSAFILSLSAYFFLRTQIKYDILAQYDLWKLLEYLSITITAPLFYLYLRKAMGAPIRGPDWVLCGFSVGVFVLFFFFHEAGQWYAINSLLNQPLWLVMMVRSTVTMVVRLRTNQQAVPLFWGTTVVFVSLISDILVGHDVPVFRQIGFTAQYVFTAFIVVTSWTRASNFEALQQQVLSLNRELSTLVERRTHQLHQATEQLSLLQAKEQSILARLEQLMTVERPYLNPKVELGQLAAKLSVTRNQLSAAINRGYGKNFSDFINEYRLQEFLKNLNAPSNAHKKMISLAFESGFPSKPTFNVYFKWKMGVTPSEFRKTSGE